MFGLPIFRSGTKIIADRPRCPDDPGYGQTCDEYTDNKLKSALRLAQMVFNHYTIIISADWKRLRAWGGCSTYGKTATPNTNTPQTSLISWDVPSAPESINKVFSNGNIGGWGVGFTIFRTDEKNLYGTGVNSTNILGRGDAGTSYKLIAKDVIDFCVAGGEYMLFVTSDGRLWGLGGNLDAGFGFSAATRKALPTHNPVTLANYLNINNASKVFAVSPGNNNKSFVLLTDGRVKACGHNINGCLGVNSNNNLIYEWMYVKTYDFQGNIVDLTDVVDVVTTNFVLEGGANSGAERWKGGVHTAFMSTYFLTKDGSVYTCGSNNFGQLGLGLPVNEKRNIAIKTSITNASLICTTAGGTSVLVTTLNNEVYTWGNNQWGQLGHGDLNNRNIPTKAVFPDKRIKMIHGGGMYGCINGAFLVICDDGTLYGAGFNETYALGVTNLGIPNPGPITVFTRNEYFGENPLREQDPERYPITINGFNTTVGSNKVNYMIDFQTKNVSTKAGTAPENIYFRVGMRVEGPGIPPQTYITYIDRNKKYFIMTKNATLANVNITLTFINIVFVYQADLCGYGTEMAQKVVSEDGTLFMSGWNQRLPPWWNFNYYYGSENVAVPTFFSGFFA